MSREGIKARKLRKYLDIISITDKQRGISYALYTSRADLNKLYSKGRKRGTFYQMRPNVANKGFTTFGYLAPTPQDNHANYVNVSLLH